MKGISKERYNEIVDFIQEWHPFTGKSKDRSMHPKMAKYGLGIKYINAYYDTRTGDVYKIELSYPYLSFDVMNIVKGDIRENYDNLGDYIMDYLKGEISL